MGFSLLSSAIVVSRHPQDFPQSLMRRTANNHHSAAERAARVLVLSGEIPQTRNAGGIVLWRLFSGYAACEKLKHGKAERLKEESGEGEPETGDRGQAADGMRPTAYGASRESQAKLFVIGPRPHAEAELLDCPYRELRMPLARLEKTRLSMHKRSLAALGLVPLPSHEHVMSLLGDFKPEVVVCVMANTPWILTAERTARKLGVPLVLIVHDINEEFEKVFPWAKKALFRKNRGVYRAASRRLCVSPEMAEFLEKRYGVPGEVMYPNRSEELQPRAAELSLTLRAAADQKTKRRRDQETDASQAGDFDRDHFDILKDSSLVTRLPGGHLAKPRFSSQASAPLTLGYAGSLAYGYGEALVALIPVLREVGARILISTPRPPEKLKVLLEATDVVEWMPHRADIMDLWRTMQERADVMILPYSNPAGPHELLYRTHFPSKLTEYLALGMPVVVSGPEEATGVRYANAEKLTTGAEGRAGEPAEGSPKGDTSGAREATSNKLEHQSFQNLPKGGLAEPRLSISEFLDFAPNGAIPCTSREELVAVLRRLKEDGGLRKELAGRTVEVGRRDFDPLTIRLAFWDVLDETCGR
jgi:glycosyltransferase involved in cell wall biosynthesis